MQALKNSDFMYFSLCKLKVLLYTVINTISYEIHLVLKFQSKLELKFHISSYPFQHKKKIDDHFHTNSCKWEWENIACKLEIFTSRYTCTCILMKYLLNAVYEICQCEKNQFQNHCSCSNEHSPWQIH